MPLTSEMEVKLNAYIIENQELEFGLTVAKVGKVQIIWLR